MRELKYIRYYSIGIAIKFFLDDNDGKAHLIEHCIMSGQQEKGESIITQLMKQGCVCCDARTYNDCTEYVIISDEKENFYNSVSILLHEIFSPSFLINKSIFDREIITASDLNGNIICEMKNFWDNLRNRIKLSVKQKMCLGTYAYTSGGLPEKISKISYEELVEFYYYNYRIERASIFVNENVDIKEVQKIINDIKQDVKDNILKKINIKRNCIENISVPSYTSLIWFVPIYNDEIKDTIVDYILSYKINTILQLINEKLDFFY